MNEESEIKGQCNKSWKKFFTTNIVKISLLTFGKNK